MSRKLSSRLLTGLLALSIALCFPSLAPAQDDAGEGADAVRAFEESLAFRTGTVELEDGLATLNLDEAYKFLGPEDTERVLVDAWGNPPGSESLGMIFPAEYGPFDEEGWAVIIQYSKDGYVSDEDAETIDFDDLLETMQSDTLEANDARTEAGYEAIELVGWAEAPSYDASSHKLYWAKELAFGRTPEHTLNYNIRVLGRRGVLVLNAVAGMSQLRDVRTRMTDVLPRVEFNSGSRYTDFDPSVDEVAAYGIGALVAGKLAAKAGLLAKLGAVLLAGKKFLWVAILGIAAFFRRLFSGSSETSGTPDV